MRHEMQRNLVAARIKGQGWHRELDEVATRLMAYGRNLARHQAGLPAVTRLELLYDEDGPYACGLENLGFERHG